MFLTIIPKSSLHLNPNIFRKFLDVLRKIFDVLEMLILNCGSFKENDSLVLQPCHFSGNKGCSDLQDILQRFTFDNICKLVLDYDPQSLSIDLPYVPCEKAFNGTVEALLYRHILPESVWKLQKWLGVGKERKLIEAWKAFDEFIYPHITLGDGEQKDDSKLLTTFRKAYEEKNIGSSRGLSIFLRDTALNLMFAGRDTTSTCLTWLFWLIATNPLTETKIQEETESKLHLKEDKNWRFFSVEESRKLVYLHGALCESLRLFPPVALEHKAPTAPDTLPTGNYLELNTKVIVSFYSTGRMESVWGKDCLEFKPERWISQGGGMKHEPSYKFPAFNAGPRTCLGKNGFRADENGCCRYHISLQHSTCGGSSSDP
ncbi:UNVERIFIED_CONTAM: Alkane hydroxylase MAH1 [Sesamum latifolium]|uniref:Alkane hydroxylase MAH1 n=1 Tax=Sesamum latifolium TaxID=2727402 RepID=A0AAW2WQY0_9LAMI